MTRTVMGWLLIGAGVAALIGVGARSALLGYQGAYAACVLALGVILGTAIIVATRS